MSIREGQPDHPDKMDHPGRLARALAELHARLRLSRSGSAGTPAALDRLLVTAALLPELSSHDAGFVTLGRNLDRLMAAVGADPRLWPDHLDPHLGALAEFLEGVLADADAGAAFPGDAETWRRQVRLWNADGEPGEDVGDRPSHGGIVVLVVDGVLRREQVRARVRAAGFEAVTSEAVDAPALVAASGAVGIVADDHEPARNLTRLATGGDVAGGCPLVLLSAGVCDPDAEAARARRAGASGAWCEPWAPETLARIIESLHDPD